MPKYPSPCDSCPSRNGPCPGKDCDRWQIRYRYRQKQINAYAKQLVESTAIEKRNVWTYPRPDEVRRYLQTNPCEKCMCRNFCKGNCAVKRKWLQATQRKQVGV